MVVINDLGPNAVPFNPQPALQKISDLLRQIIVTMNSQESNTNHTVFRLKVTREGNTLRQLSPDEIEAVNTADGTNEIRVGTIAERLVKIMREEPA